MKYLEIFELITSDSDHHELEEFLAYWKKELSRKNPDLSVTIYSHINVQCSYSIHIMQDVEKNSNTASLRTSAGLILRNELSEFGLVNYTAWAEHDW